MTRLTGQLDDLYAVSSQRAVTGTLSSHPDCRDVHIDSLSITFHGAELLVDARLELNNGRRYGLIGLNGCGAYHLHINVAPFSPRVIKSGIPNWPSFYRGKFSHISVISFCGKFTADN